MESLSDRTLLVTVDSLRFDQYEQMEQTHHALGPSHPRAFATSNATAYSFQSILGGSYPTAPGLDTGRSLAHEFDAAGIRTFGYQSNPLLGSKYGYAEGFGTYQDTTPSAGPVKRYFEKTLDQDTRLYSWAATAFNQFQRARTALGSDQERKYPAADQLITQAIADVEHGSAPADSRWFVWVHLMEPHHPYNPSSPFTDTPRARAQTLTRKALAGRASPSEQQTVRDLYNAEVQQVDAALARLWQWAPDDTRIVFCADHGELLGHDDNDWGHIDSFTPEILHVPLATQNTPELTGPVASLVDVPSLVLGEEHAQGRFDRETAYAADGEGRAITDGTTVLSETDAFDISGEPTTAEKALHRKLSRFKPDIGENGLQSVVDKEDLETLGYA